MIFFDVSDLDLEGYNKFIPYLLHPECVYSISVSASAVRAKVSLGTNPWNQATAARMPSAHGPWSSTLAARAQASASAATSMGC